MSRAGRAAPATSGWRVLLPPGWLTLPTERQGAAEAVSRLLDSALRGKPRDELIDARITLDRALREQIARAEKAGAHQLHALVRPVRGLPVSATLLTRQVASQDPDAVAAALNTLLGEAAGVVEHGYVDLPDRGALRRVRRWTPTLELDGQRMDQMMTAVEYVVPIEEDRVLILAFSTSTEPVHEELVVLFDAIAATLHRSETVDE